ncbi:MAG: ankyrin repeat domain-containing protein, partial [Acidobacteriota bacterium]
MQRIFGSVAIFLLLPLAGFAAVRPDVADAVMRGDKTAVRKLLAEKADVNVAQSDGATALHWAVFQSDKEMVDLLLRAGANAKAANREGATSLWLASV